jgi:putative hydrolase of the HAD superfamily
MRPNLSHVETWIFDLDNTLYHPSARLFDQINARMTGFIMHEFGVGRAAADEMRRSYWQRHGTTLGGLIENHRIDPARFLDEAHAIEDKGLVAKPRADAYRRVIRLSGLDPARSAMIEEDVRNLEAPKALGMTTIWLCHQAGASAPAFVDRRITLLMRFLQEFV